MFLPSENSLNSENVAVHPVLEDHEVSCILFGKTGRSFMSLNVGYK